MQIRRLSNFIVLLAALAVALTFAVQARAVATPKDCGMEQTNASWSSGNVPASVRPHDECLANVRVHKHGLVLRVSRHT